MQAGAGTLLPELALAVFMLLLVFLDLFRNEKLKQALPYVALLGLALTLGLQVLELERAPLQYSFLNLLLKDGLSRYAGLLFSVAGILTVFLSVLPKTVQKRFGSHGEYYAILLALLLGLNLMVRSANLLMLFLSIEFVSIASYILTAWRREEKRPVEAGLKYILFGTFSAGVMLYGMSFLYGFTGSISFTGTEFWQALAAADSPLVLVALVLTLAGLLFKLAAAPFHFWAPDVYEGAPAPVAALFATAPKAAAVLVLYRFTEIFSSGAFLNHFSKIGLFFGMVALLTLAVGNFTALFQGRFRRLLAYSSVSHAGFLLAALLAFHSNNLPAVLFYLTVLLFANYGLFLLVQLFEQSSDSLEIKDCSGLGRSHPYVGVLALLFLVSLTGLPPTAGFTAKLFIFTNIWESYSVSGDYLLLLLLVAGLLFTGVAIFYYIRLPYFLFFKRNLTGADLVIPMQAKVLLTLLALPVLLFFFKAGWLLQFIQNLI